jgi:hypothetical protein
MTTRRRFIMMVPLTGAALAAACSDKAAAPEADPATAPPAPAQTAAPAAEPTPAAPVSTGAMVDEADATAMALGYVADAARVDTVKHPNFAAGSACANCVLYQGAAGSEAGPCPLFASKQVSAQGWCVSYAKKPS